jgi:hypothetical protein
MRFSLYIGALIAMAMWSSFCSGQYCDSGLTNYQVQCVYDNSCSEEITVSLPNGEYGDRRIACYSVNCCGELHSTCYDAGPCQGAIKAGMTPGVRKYLEKLALDSELLVADCSGHYAPFKAAAPNANKSASLAILNDRLLR